MTVPLLQIDEIGQSSTVISLVRLHTIIACDYMATYFWLLVMYCVRSIAGRHGNRANTILNNCMRASTDPGPRVKKSGYLQPRALCSLP
jgi:hypothetical protein